MSRQGIFDNELYDKILLFMFQYLTGRALLRHYIYYSCGVPNKIRYRYRSRNVSKIVLQID